MKVDSLVFRTYSKESSIIYCLLFEFVLLTQFHTPKADPTLYLYPEVVAANVSPHPTPMCCGACLGGLTTQHCLAWASGFLLKKEKKEKANCWSRCYWFDILRSVSINRLRKPRHGVCLCDWMFHCLMYAAVCTVGLSEAGSNSSTVSCVSVFFPRSNTLCIPRWNWAAEAQLILCCFEDLDNIIKYSVNWHFCCTN